MLGENSMSVLKKMCRSLNLVTRNENDCVYHTVIKLLSYTAILQHG